MCIATEQNLMGKLLLHHLVMIGLLTDLSEQIIQSARHIDATGLNQRVAKLRNHLLLNDRFQKIIACNIEPFQNNGLAESHHLSRRRTRKSSCLLCRHQCLHWRFVLYVGHSRFGPRTNDKIPVHSLEVYARFEYT